MPNNYNNFSIPIGQNNFSIPIGKTNYNIPTGLPANYSTLSLEEKLKAKIEAERLRRINAGMDVSGDWASPEWINQVRNEILQESITQKSDELSDPNSKYYTDYYKQLKGTLSAQSSLNSLLGLNRAMGLGMESSATIANEQRNALEGKITDYAGQSTKNLFQSNLGASNSLLGMGLQNTADLRNYFFQKEQYNDSKKFDWAGLASTIGQIAGIVLAPATGGISSIASTALSGGMSLLKKTPNPTQGRNTNLGNWGNWSGGY